MTILTGDELTALAHCFGVPRFPGVSDSLYDSVDPDLHPLLDNRFLATIAARGYLAADDDGDLWPDEPLAALLEAVSSHRTYIAVEQHGSAGELFGAVMAGEDGIVRHAVAEPLHQLELDPAASLPSLLGSLVDPSPGPGRSGRRRRWGRRSDLLGIVPAPEGGWRRVTVLARTDQTDGTAYVEGFLAVFDGGPGELWLVTEYDDGPEHRVVAEPASYDEVQNVLRAFTEVGAVHG